MSKLKLILISTAVLLFVYLTHPLSPVRQEKLKEKMNLRKPVKLDEETMIKIAIAQLTQGFGESFKYLRELEAGKYRMKKNSEYTLIEVLNQEGNIKDSFKLNYITSTEGIVSLVLNEEDYQQLISFKNKSKVRENELPSNFPEVFNNILWDQEILRYDEEYTLGKIFNRVIALDKTVNQYELGSVVFYDIDDGILIPYDDGQGAKLLISDGGWSSIMQFDARNTTQINSYGSFGTGNNNFIFNNGITFGRSYSQGDDVIYPVYIADVGNNRIILIDYVINEDNGAGYFNSSTFSVFVDNLKSPFDISYFFATQDANDKLWVSEASARQPALTCISKSGEIVQRVKGYKYGTSGDSLLKEFSLPRLCTYNSFGALVFIDNKRNVVVPCKLDTNGFATIYTNQNGDTIIQSYIELITFPQDYPVTSVNIQRTSYGTGWYPYLWITTKNEGNNIAMVHAFALNSNANWAYLGSADRPRNTSYYFRDLTNTFSTNHYFDFFTSEIWTDAYGLRRFLPFIEIRDDYVESYCIDSTDRLLWKAGFTNECWIKVWAERKVNSTTWEQVAIKEIEGSVKPPNTYEAVIWRLKGYTAISGEDPIDIKLNIPLKDYVLGGSVRLHARLYPEYFDYNNLNQYDQYIPRDYEVDVLKTCLPKPGGCPFLYVRDENLDYTVDNNLLHRSEFTPGDITDVYKLQVTPSTSDNKVEVYLVENEDDLGYIGQVKMYAVDYPDDKRLAITEDNQIVVYDSVTVKAADTVLLNGNDITPKVHYHQPNTPVDGSAGDYLLAKFNYLTPLVRNNKNKDVRGNSKSSQINDAKTGRNENTSKDSQSNNKDRQSNNERAKSIVPQGWLPKTSSREGGFPIAFIAELRNVTNPVPGVKDTAGYLTAYSITGSLFSSPFARRELSSVVVLSLFASGDLVDSLEIDWQSAYNLKKLGIATLDYNNFTAREMSLAEGKYITLTVDSNITTILTSIDGEYGEVNSSALLKLQFDASQLPPISSNYKREYVIEVTGNYVNGDGDSPLRVKTELPLTYRLSQNYPNPFNPITKINYELPKNSRVNLVVYDILGREVIRLVNNEVKEAGRYTATFDALNFASGVYFYRIEAGNFVQSRKMVLIK
ncbi:MAG: T9SS type A sorting domain-containing protein [Chlorobi bacterium]|nr:T9SS type A sorting domain-containing protein [Chlorobiota bacterium]MCI0716933.1 T9SS type A sorting domain-containing protein [Chlorobiota bacterium]